MKIDAIKNGIVIDHVEAGKGKEIYDFLELENLTCPVALIRNVPSKKTGIKDIIKIDEIIDIDMDVLGYIAPEATVSIIKDGKIESKRKIALPEVIKNVSSKKTGKKDIIKIDASIDLNFEVLGYIAPEVTVNVIKNGVTVEKVRPESPKLLKNVIKCKNPRCITSVEQGIDQCFKLTDSGVYRCIYCESKAKD